MAKYLEVTFPDNSVWRIPLKPIAENRAAYYAKLDVERGDADDYDAAFAIEVEWVLEDYYEAIDWAENQMGWSDFKDYAQMVVPPTPVPYEDSWPHVPIFMKSEDEE